jgi:hypothetical protein
MMKSFNNLYSSPVIITVMKLKDDEMVGACSKNGDDKKCIRNFNRKT